MRITPYFELKNGNRYEFKKTRWLVAEHQRLNEELDISAEDKENAVKANNLVADAKKFSDKANECWEKLCAEPTEENQRIYFMFKNMSDKAVEDYNAFVAQNNTVAIASKHTYDILERIAIKALAEQYFSMNENIAKQTWEMFVDEQESHDVVIEWLSAMAECLFGEEDEVEDNSFLSQMRKKKAEQAENRRNAIKKR
jgi:hypothetical protein